MLIVHDPGVVKPSFDDLLPPSPPNTKRRLKLDSVEFGNCLHRYVVHRVPGGRSSIDEINWWCGTQHRILDFSFSGRVEKGHEIELYLVSGVDCRGVLV